MFIRYKRVVKQESFEVFIPFNIRLFDWKGYMLDERVGRVVERFVDVLINVRKIFIIDLVEK